MKLITFYGSRGLRIVKGENQYVWDDKGRRYLDLHAGHGVAFLGHRNPKVVEYLKRQLDTIITLTTAFDIDIRDEMLKEIDDLKPEGMDNIFLLNSGTEAVELAMKIARKITGRKKFIAFKNSFHGRTMGSLSITWNKKYREPFEPLISPIEFLEFNQIDELKKLDDSVAAVILEPVQGEGGVIPAKPEFVKALREETERRGILLVSDEVQAGFGRTGKVWAYQHYGIRPDILTAGKAIGGGFPVSAVFVPDSIAEKLGEGDHGTTYGGNPMAAAAVTAASRVLKEDKVPEQAKVKGETFMKMLRDALVDFKSVREVRGLGLMIGVDLRLNPGTAIKVLQDNGVLSLKAGVSTIRFLSPYMITNQDMELAVDATRKGVAETEGKKTS
ncbi:acetylornithine aminotransferase apoenzyme / N2-acetyl-L-lysine aminotransferase apoenzyme [Metallosphaera sedula]|uniref:[LysW]-aminoadipate semialdehyde/glutamate semialdehyde transaminase n=3 Tax=Metallosphaera TaxID=41980 RepID=A4YD44_METS5|nr:MULTISPECIES: [LysW]-aminoadipate semialdehyde/glutamate semialdehyde transaminase [Metallosphaera]ABP94346.1 acetylornithine aminotransferase apoenzyme / N2-acetyl-L-lysine aminotransferase apoenzyme [Metallosphaera sedula DSM 5348]AIM26333.1 acetylornithine aminotransferase apoenzyme / N2-acetyl-L-lysine aminotransferase apoenzyme [Metallosphaera sedula]AKV73341.1 acetyl-lysine aminotransferase [Metallosphaera sedula]AKV75585.1 acetyl-lysine aminotransferase [Metallosphaera sedula]AKV7783